MNRKYYERWHELFISNRRTVVLISSLFLLPLISAFTLQVSGTLQQSGGQSTVQSGPEFKNEGQLVFLKHGTGQTITVINIEIADNDAERAQGLMWRTSMPEDDGMLFVFDQSKILTFWMKNTYIPLDMVFADSTGRIVTIHQNATPFSEATIASTQPAKYVVEVNGGFCAKYGIVDGDAISYER